MVQTRAKRWLEGLADDPVLKAELENMMNADPKQLEDCFYRSLTFGTGGMRGELGPGPNRMNRYTVRRAAAGLAQFLRADGTSGHVVIAHDSRHFSKEFAREAALTLAYANVPVYLFEDLRPTPLLSYAVRASKAAAGMMITASHNPAEYNGLKVYGADGAQLLPEPSERLIAYVEGIEEELAIPVMDEEEARRSGLLAFLPPQIDENYIHSLGNILPNPELGRSDGHALKIVFTPLHGTAKTPLLRAFEENGYTNVRLVQDQAAPDPDFSTVEKPNPEEAQAFQMAKVIGKECGADLLIATDPDADRVGIAVRDHKAEDGYQLLTGNETGLLLAAYLLEQKKAQGNLPSDGRILKTIVTSESGRALAEAYGLVCEETLTGFKFIAQKIREYEQGAEGSFLFGYEESYGYLIGDFVRDKDALQAALLAAEAALYEKKQEQTLLDKLDSLYSLYGRFQEGIESYTFKGKEGQEKIDQLLSSLRSEQPAFFGAVSVTAVEDYQARERVEVKTGKKQPLQLPAANVIKFILEDDSWVCVRPSGTEPKMKCYFGVRKANKQEARSAMEKLKEAATEEITARTATIER